VSSSNGSIHTPDVAIVGATGALGFGLAVRLAAIQMDIKVLFVSGYAGAGVLRREKVVELKAAFLRKPFTAEQLAERVQSLLAPQAVKTVQSGAL